MKTICVLTLKGGVGKTLTSTTLAYLLAKEKDKRVLLIDADYQGDASATFEAYSESRCGLAELMKCGIEQDKELNTNEYIVHTDYGVDLIPANWYLEQVNSRVMMEKELNQINILSNALAQVNDTYDFCVIDCGRSLDMTVQNAVVAADILISPMLLGGYELVAAEKLEDQMFDIRTLNPSLELYCLITRFTKSKTTQAIEHALKDRYLSAVFETRIRNSLIVTRNSFEKGPFPFKSKNSIAVKDYRSLLDEVLEVL